jgi:hypothetical protein
VNALDAKIATLDKDPGNGKIVQAFRSLKADIAKRWNLGERLADDGEVMEHTKDLRNAVTPTRELRKLIDKKASAPDEAAFLADYLSGHVAEAAKTGEAGRAASALQSLDRDINTATLLRDNLAQKAAGKGDLAHKLVTGAGTAGAAFHAFTRGHPLLALGEVAAGIAAKPAAQATNRAALSALRHEGDSAVARNVLALIEKGVPIAAAVHAAQAQSKGDLGPEVVGAASSAADLFGSGH